MALKSGKDILLEKPVGIDINEAEKLSKKIASYKGTVALGYEFRINPAIMKIKELVESGEIGEIMAFSLYHFRTPFKRDKWNSWIQKKEFSGGLLIEETCHWFDLARYLTNMEIENLHCVKKSGINKGFDFEDIAYINGRYQNDGILQISHALTGFDFSLQICLHGKNKTVWCSLKEEESSVLDGGATNYYAIVSSGRPGEQAEKASIWKWGSEATEPENIRDLAADFADRLSLGKGPMASWKDGCESLRLSVKALESAASGRVVAIE